MHALHVRRELDDEALADIQGLIDETTEVEGHSPIGEHKLSHLALGAEDWDGVLAYDGRRLIGYAHLRWNAPGMDPRLTVEVVVHPDRRDEGVQAALLGTARGLMTRDGGGRMFLWVHRVQDPRATLAADMGFEIQRELAFMRRPALPMPEEPTVPEGITIRTYEGPADDKAFLEVNNAAFAGHPENGSWGLDELRVRQALPWFDPRGVFLACRRGELLGFHWTKWQPRGEGEVYVLAVHPSAQGMGLGRILLRTGMRHLAPRSEDIVLYVDAAQTGPVRLYESEGFRTAYRDVCYVA